MGGYPRLLAGNFVDDFFVGDVAFDGGLADEEEGRADCERYDGDVVDLYDLDLAVE